MSNDWIDAEGFRANVGIILTNSAGKLLLGGRAGSKGWQFPQGGVQVGEDPEDAMYRELREEVGLERNDVELLGVTSDWLRYRLPDKFVRRNSTPLCIGQKQRWFAIRFLGDDDEINITPDDHPIEFDKWRWAASDELLDCIVAFKRDVYREVLEEFSEVIRTA